MIFFELIVRYAIDFMAGTRTKRSVASAIALLGVLAGMAYYVDEGERIGLGSGRRGTAAEGGPSVEDLIDKYAVPKADLPSGTEKTWLEYVDRRIAATMKRKGSTVQVSPLEIQGFETYISINTPYKITCLGPVSSVKFGTGKDGITVLIYPWKGQPALGVDRTSIAAKKLDEALCRKISDRVQAIMSPR